jgi:DtxR family manganese transport transcriptional regulator
MPPRASTSTVSAPASKVRSARSSTASVVPSAPVPSAPVAVAATNGAAPIRFQRTRAAHKDETAEDYVEAVAQLILEAGEARVGELARIMGVSHVTVSKTVARLAERRLVNAPAYKPITLTPAGRKLAERAAERHVVVLAFLRKLGVREEQAQIDAEGIEHHVSGATIAAMQRWLDGAVSRGARDQNAA